jgi:hypothetical protein
MSLSSEIVVGLILGTLVAVLVYSGMRAVPGIVILVALAAVAAFVIWVNDEGLASIGFLSPDDWVSTVTLGVVVGILLQLLAVVIIVPVGSRMSPVTRLSPMSCFGGEGRSPTFTRFSVRIPCVF